MNGAHLHLLLNHVPILGSLFALCLLLYGLIIKSDSVVKAALLAMVVATLMAIPVYLSGEEAEHVVEPIIGINETAMEAHEDSAEFAFWAMLMGGAIALGTLFAVSGKKAVASTLVWVNFIMMVIVFTMMARTGWLGGEIRHSEINAATISTGGGEEGDED